VQAKTSHQTCQESYCGTLGSFLVFTYAIHLLYVWFCSYSFANKNISLRSNYISIVIGYNNLRLHSSTLQSTVAGWLILKCLPSLPDSGLVGSRSHENVCSRQEQISFLRTSSICSTWEVWLPLRWKGLCNIWGRLERVCVAPDGAPPAPCTALMTTVVNFATSSADWGLKQQVDGKPTPGRDSLKHGSRRVKGVHKR
jgi:hypothetical protein